MKKFVVFLLSLLSVYTYSGVLYAQNEGSDNFGYTWKNNQAPGGPSYEWIDISDGTPLMGMADDNFSAPLPLGFTFKYYWLDYTTVYVGTNGYLMFGQGMNVASDASGFPEFPVPGGATSPNNYVGIFLSDLTSTDHFGNPVPDCSIKYKAIGNKFVVTYENIPFWVRETEVASGYRGKNTFQIVLDGSDNSITLNYKEQQGQVSSAYATSTFLVRGMENVTGQLGSMFSKNAYPAASSCIKINYPQSTNYTFRDVLTQWINVPQNNGVIKLQGDPEFKMQAGVRNAGTGPVDAGTNVRVVRRIYDETQGGAEINALRDTVIISDGMASGETKMVEFNKPINPNQIGNFRIRVETTMQGDQYQANNVSNGELCVVKGSDQEILLGYDKFVFFDIINWGEGDGISGGLNVGMEITPPFYPCYVNRVMYGMVFGQNGAAPDTLLPVRGTILASDGPNGGPGTLLREFVISPEEMKDYYDEQQTGPAGVGITYTLPQHIKLESGSVFISFSRVESPDTVFNNNALNFLAAEEGVSVPTSFRSYEINGGVWAPYRSRSTTDFSIWAMVSKQPLSTGEKLNPFTQDINLYPNPSNGAATLAYTLKQKAPVRIVVKNMLGQEVANHNLGLQHVGNHNFNFNEADFQAAGVYSYTLEVGASQSSGKIVITK